MQILNRNNKAMKIKPQEREIPWAFFILRECLDLQ